MASLRAFRVRPAPALGLALALGSGLGAGCLIVETEPASGCTLPRECPIDPELTIAGCSDGWEFSDGSSTDDERTALETC